jgi:hypothetical protein
MACQTCGGTMQGVGYGIFHCPRCGTMKNLDGSLTTPALVTRCREFEEALVNPATGPVGANLRLLWHTEGIDESIRPPGQRGEGH